MRINYNNQSRDSMLCVPSRRVKSLYRALKLFNDVAYDPDNVVLYRMKAGKLEEGDDSDLDQFCCPSKGSPQTAKKCCCFHDKPLCLNLASSMSQVNARPSTTFVCCTGDVATNWARTATGCSRATTWTGTRS